MNLEIPARESSSFLGDGLRRWIFFFREEGCKGNHNSPALLEMGILDIIIVGHVGVWGMND